MGIIKRQGIKNLLVNYVGVGIGFIATLFVYNLDRELYGFAQFLTSSAIFLIPFMTLGVVGLVLKYYPEFDLRFPDRSFIKSIYKLFALSSILFVALYFLLQEKFLALMRYLKIDRQGILEDHILLVVILTIILAANRIFILHCSNLRRIVIPEILSSLSFKIALPILVLLGYHGYVNKEETSWLIIIFYAVVCLFLAIYLARLGGFRGAAAKWREIAHTKRREIRSFTFYSALNSLSASFAFRLDMIMLSAMLGFTSNGAYALILFLTNVIDIPRRSLSKIISPVLSNAATAGDQSQIEDLYQKASINLLVPSTFLFILIWSCLPELDKIVSGDPIFWESRHIFLFLALGRLIDMLLSMNTEIITYSKYYRYNLLFIIILAICNFLLNYTLISRYEILGAALATFGAFVIYNLLKGTLLWRTMGILPFHRSTWALLGLTLLTMLTLMLIPRDWSIWVNVPLKVIICGLLYALPVLYFNLSQDINDMLRGVRSKIRTSWKR